mmetsp:Transcript_2525/g.2487  ORF Transcript_2525/g.2487 Transcript_2525/m.2487 type:complete len:220 (-) Transcript_2525:259-918(-)
MTAITLTLISLNTIFHFATFILLCIGFATSQWAVKALNCSCSGDCIYYIGLFKVRFTEVGKCSEDSKDATCDYFGLSDDNCDSYTSAKEAAQLALALSVVMVVWKIIVNGLTFKFLKEKTRVIWILFLLATITDFIIGFSAFISAGQFAEIDNWHVYYVANPSKEVQFDHGFGWQCFIGAGVAAWLVCILGGLTLWRGLVPAEKETPATQNLGVTENTA